MAVYRHVHIDFWQDGFILDLTPEEKYFYMYLMTNSKTSQCGIYELPKRIIETETGYNRETVEKLIARFEGYKKIVYCEDSKEIFIVNWIKHNKPSSPKVRKCVEKELKSVKSDYIVALFLKECDKYGYSIDSPNVKLNISVDSLATCIDSANTTMDSVSIGVMEVDLGFEDHYGEKEKEKQKQNSEPLGRCENNVGKYAKLYEENIGLINGVASEWLID